MYDSQHSQRQLDGPPWEPWLPPRGPWTVAHLHCAKSLGKFFPTAQHVQHVQHTVNPKMICEHCQFDLKALTHSKHLDYSAGPCLPLMSRGQKALDHAQADALLGDGEAKSAQCRCDVEMPQYIYNQKYNDLLELL